MTTVFEKVRYFEENANFTFRNNIRNYFSLNNCFCTALCIYVLKKELQKHGYIIITRNNGCFFETR